MMPSRTSNVQPISHWRDAEARIAMAEIHAQAYGSSVIETNDDPTFGTLTVSGKVGSFRYVANYRPGWPGNGRKPKSMSQHDAISLLCECAQVAAAREYVAANPLPPAAEYSDEAKRVAEWAAVDRPLQGERFLR